MDKSLLVELSPPRFANHRSMHIAGLGERFTFETNEGIPKLWNRFKPHIDHVPGQVGTTAYGVCRPGDADGSFEYVAGVEVSGFAGIPLNFSRVEIPSAKYAVFTHRNHISTIRSTIYTIWNKWLPESQFKFAESPDFERYGEDFNPRTGNGTVEIWLPIRE